MASPANTPKIGFYKSFGRPIAKVFLGAMFTYQMTYLLWLKLETQEVKASKTGDLVLLLFTLATTESLKPNRMHWSYV